MTTGAPVSRTIVLSILAPLHKFSCRVANPMKYLTERWHFGNWIVLGVFILASVRSTESGAIEEGAPYAKWEMLARDHAYVTPVSVSSPLSRLVLVRYMDTLCAIRFNAFHRGGDEKAPTKFNSGEETLFATAEQIRIVRTATTWRILERKTINLVRGSIVGLGRLGFEKGRIGLRCGDALLEWTYPNNVSLGSYTQKPDKRAEVQVAPTAWSDVSQIELSDKRLRWYHFDEDRRDSVFAISELPGFNLN
jgi:hypothetical protein